MANITLKLLIDSEKNSLTYSKNFRIFSTGDPVKNITGLVEIVEDLIINDPAGTNPSNINRSFRYSRNKMDWSLWYEISPGGIGSASEIIFEEGSDFYFELKYEYDDGTFNELQESIEVNEIKLRFSSIESSPNTFAPHTVCSDEKCTSIVAESDPAFRPYQVDSAIGMYKELSFYANTMFGHDVVYFRTVPESDSGDYIFKEWTLFKNVDRKCLKVLVPKNSFPSNDPKYTEFGLDFQMPFEIHVDHRYFQSIFGKETHPRHRDFLYFPLLNRMYEITGTYLHRAFMMTPSYWKITLQKYNPNIDMLLTDDSRHFLDNVIQSSEDLFKEEVTNDIEDAILPTQYDTISQRFDPSRHAIHPDLTIRPLKYNFNYASLIDNYYDLSSIPSVISEFTITNDNPLTRQSVNLETLESLDAEVNMSHDVILAYQGSGPYLSWKNNSLITTDKNIKDLNSKYLRVRGPIDSIPNHEGQSEEGRYIRLEAYSDLSFKKQRNIMHSLDNNGVDKVKFKIRESSIMYNAEPVFNSSDVSNISYTSLFNLNSSSDVVQYINGYDNESQLGMKLSGQFTKYFGTQPEGDFTVTLQLNQSVYSYTINNFISGNWHAIVTSISNEFNQIGVYVYSIKEDPSDIINHTGFIQSFKSIEPLPKLEFNLPGEKYYIPSSDMLISNIRLFKTMIKEEDHEFILSQQYVKDESQLLIIDNCKPQINLPYISKNR